MIQHCSPLLSSLFSPSPRPPPLPPLPTPPLSLPPPPPLPAIPLPLSLPLPLPLHPSSSPTFPFPLCLPLLSSPSPSPPPYSSVLNVTTLPDVLFQNSGVVHSIAEGSVIWLYCTADSTTSTPSITWTKDGVTLVNDPPHIRIRSSNDTLLSTTSSLVVDNFGLADDDGTYQCQASDGTAVVSSSTLSLTGRPG